VSKIHVLVVDDSALVRQTMERILSSDSRIGPVITASDPLIAMGKMEKSMPDVILLDVEMPRMDGLTFLKKLMSENPLPVVLCSSLSNEGSKTALRALELGAAEIIAKPKVGTKKFIEESKVLIIDAVMAAHSSVVRKSRPKPTHTLKVEPKLTADVMLPRRATTAMLETTEKVVLVGASTGGTEALREFLEALPLDSPSVVIVQHMPEHFTRAFSERLDGLCRVTVKEAEHGDTVLRGRALIAPGGRHLLIKRSGARYYVEVKDGPLVSRHRPSVDVLFRSGARYCGANAVGVIMTGMGDDGARGMLEMKEAGAYNIAQDEASSVVFGMPKEAIRVGGVDKVFPLGNLAPAVLNACS
jgi:two-component system, chemotaxis family, protein-glutamate methylesterase/glutaminase